MNQRHPDVGGAGIAAFGVGAAEIGAGQHPYPRLAPQPPAGRLAVADFQPQEEAAGRAIEAEAPLQLGRGGVELGAILRPVLFDMNLVAPQRRLLD